MSLPAIPTGTIDQSTYWRLDLETRQEMERSAVQYRIDHLAQEERRIEALKDQTAAMREQVAAMNLARQALDGFTDGELLKGFTEALLSAWGAGTTPGEIAPQAAAVLAGYRKIIPAPTTTA